jgi:hypothetical protein
MLEKYVRERDGLILDQVKRNLAIHLRRLLATCLYAKLGPVGRGLFDESDAP